MTANTSGPVQDSRETFRLEVHAKKTHCEACPVTLQQKAFQQTCAWLP